MPLGDAPRDPKPTPQMLRLIADCERELEADFWRRQAEKVDAALAWWRAQVEAA